MTDQDDEIRLPWSRSERAIPRAVVRPMQEFLQTSISSAVLLFAAVLVALLWANLGSESYEAFWNTPVRVTIGPTVIGSDLHFWVNDGLMTVFFLLVGIEIKRELTTGELRSPRLAALPAIAALGGMVVPALLYLAIAGAGEGARGWGVPMATDIAFALGALALAATAAPANLKPMLLTLAIVDDIGAILVIAIFYSGGVSGAALLAAFGCIGLIVAAQRIHVRSPLVYMGVGAVLWYSMYRSGIHPTIAGVALGLLTPAQPFQRPAAVSAEAHRIADLTTDEPEPVDVDAPAWLRLSELSKDAVSPLARVEHALLPWSSFVIVPLFALANAGVRLSPEILRGALASTVVLAIVVGLVLGKPLGVFAASRIAVRSRLGALPEGVGWGHLLGMGATAGIGFTVALFIAQLAFPDDPGLLAEAKVAILAASVLAGVAGYVILRLARPDR